MPTYKTGILCPVDAKMHALFIGSDLLSGRIDATYLEKVNVNTSSRALRSRQLHKILLEM